MRPPHVQSRAEGGRPSIEGRSLMSLVSLRQQQGNSRTSSAQTASSHICFPFLSKSLPPKRRHITLYAALQPLLRTGASNGIIHCRSRIASLLLWLLHDILLLRSHSLRIVPHVTASIRTGINPTDQKSHNGLCKIRHQLSNCRFDHIFLAADQAQWSWRPMPFLVIWVLRQHNVCQPFLLVWIQYIPHQEWLDCAIKKLQAKHQRPRFPLQTRSCFPTKHSRAALPCDHGRSVHLSCDNALATVSRGAPAVFCPWQAATSCPGTDPSRPMAFRHPFLHILQPRLSQKPHRPFPETTQAMAVSNQISNHCVAWRIAVKFIRS